MSPHTDQNDIHELLSGEERLRSSYFSLSTHLKKFSACRDDRLEPLGGTIIYHFFSRGKLTKRQVVGWQYFWNDIREASGDSGNMTVSYSERVTTSTAGSPHSGYGDDDPIALQPAALSPIRMARWNQEYERAERITGMLSSRQKGILEQLVRDHIRCSGSREVHSHQIKVIASFLSGYKDDRQCNAYALGLIHDLLDRLADFYFV